MQDVLEVLIKTENSKIADIYKCRTDIKSLSWLYL